MIYQMADRESNEIIEPRIDFESVPISALRHKTREKLSYLFNIERACCSEDGHCRDWRGIYSLSGLAQTEYALISQQNDKFGKLLDLWIRKITDDDLPVNLSQLHQCFFIIDRYDIYDDTLQLMIEDAQAFLTKKNTDRKEIDEDQFELMKADPNNDIITIKDLENEQKNLPLPIYDAFVIYDEKDIEFASELIERLEKIGYLLCVKDRDLLGGLSFESDAILRLLSKRCNRLIIIVSKAFLQSPMQIFITNFAQALGIERGQRKIIPCLLEPCDLPQMLRYCYRLDYFKNNKLFDFWDKLDKSLKVKAIKDNPETCFSHEAIDESKDVKKVSDNEQTNDLVYKFTETPMAIPEKLSKKQSPESKQRIWPPPPKLRAASSMVTLNESELSNGNSIECKNSLSQSTFFLNGQPMDQNQDCKLKRKKWYSVFLPPKVVKIKNVDAETQPKKEKEKRRWYKTKKKEKIPVTC